VRTFVFSVMFVLGITLTYPPAICAEQDPAVFFKQNCAACHTIGGGKLPMGPDLKGVTEARGHEWLEEWLLNPQAVINNGDAYALKMKQDYNGLVMPTIPGMTRQMAESLLNFITAESKKGSAAAPASPAQGVQLVAQAQRDPGQGITLRGEALFVGEAQFQNGGPPCASCHSIAGLPFPNGGTLGPDLTSVYHKLGLQGMQIAIKTLYFPVMDSIYDRHPLTLDEQADLIAFFREASTQPKPRWNTQIIVLIAFGSFLILLLLTRYLWRNRLKSVRRTMVESAMRQGRFHS